MTNAELIDLALSEGFAAAAVTATEEIPFNPIFRPYCEENLCGQYGANWSCPPECGSFEEMRRRILAQKRAILLQTIWEISDYTDETAIREAKNFHNRASAALAGNLRTKGVRGFVVGASGCGLCSPCAKVTGEPCRFPEMKFSCMSAYCIFVRQLCEKCGVEYDCGPGLLGFFGLFVLEEE